MTTPPTLFAKECDYCGTWIDFPDRGSKSYQMYYGKELTPICDKCCAKLLKRGKRSMFEGD
jgi:hypothetical protein